MYRHTPIVNRESVSDASLVTTSDRHHRELIERLQIWLSDRSYKSVGNRLDIHPETVRRWIGGTSRCTGAFLVAIATEYRINPIWLLTGQGTCDPDDYHSRLLTQASTRELLVELANRIERKHPTPAPLPTVVVGSQSNGTGEAKPMDVRCSGWHPAPSYAEG